MSRIGTSRFALGIMVEWGEVVISLGRTQIWLEW